MKKSGEAQNLYMTSGNDIKEYRAVILADIINISGRTATINNYDIYTWKEDNNIDTITSYQRRASRRSDIYQGEK